MGTDIYLHAERRGTDGRWSEAKPADGSALYDSGSRPALFAVLADVRNDDPGRGEPYAPIASPRGLPPNVSPELRAAADEMHGDAHAHSWLTVRELLDFDWTQIATRRGVVFAPTFARWDGVSAPERYCVWVLGSNERELDNDAMRRLVEEARVQGYPLSSSDRPVEAPAGCSPELHDRVRWSYTTVEWRETYATTCAYLLESTLPKLRALGPPDDVRIVFWFQGH